jgi:hypothetical protein
MKTGSARSIRRLAWVLIPCLIAAAAAAATVRGRLDRVNPQGFRYPATGVAVTVYNQYMGRSGASYAGPDGMYYLYNIPPGQYYLEVWISHDPRIPPTVYPISVYEPYSDVPPIVVP